MLLIFKKSKKQQHIFRNVQENPQIQKWQIWGPVYAGMYAPSKRTPRVPINTSPSASRRTVVEHVVEHVVSNMLSNMMSKKMLRISSGADHHDRVVEHVV